MPRAAKTAARGYGGSHQKERARWAVILRQRGQLSCARGCGGIIRPGDDWDLDHTDDRSAYRGPAHRHCNRRAGAIKGNRNRRGRRLAMAISRLRW